MRQELSVKLIEVPLIEDFPVYSTVEKSNSAERNVRGSSSKVTVSKLKRRLTWLNNDEDLA